MNKFKYGKLEEFKYGRLYESVARYFNTLHNLIATNKVIMQDQGKMNTIMIAANGRKLNHEDKIIPRPNNDTMYASAFVDIENAPVIVEIPKLKEGRSFKYISANITTLAHLTTVAISTTKNKVSGKYALVWSKGNYDKNVDGVDEIIELDSAKAIQVIRMAINYNNEEEIKEAREFAQSIKLTGKSDHLITEDSVLGNKDIVLTRTVNEFLINLKPVLEIIKNYTDIEPGNPVDDLLIEVLNEYGIDILSDEELDISKINIEEFVNESQKIINEYTNNFALEGSINKEWAFQVFENKLFAADKKRYNELNQPHAMNYAGIYGPLALNSDQALYSGIITDKNDEKLIANQTYKVTVKGEITNLVNAFWSITAYDQETGFFFKTDTWRYATGSLLEAEKTGDDFIIFVGPNKPEGVKDQNFLQTDNSDSKVDLTFRTYYPSNIKKALEFISGKESKQNIKIEKV